MVNGGQSTAPMLIWHWINSLNGLEMHLPEPVASVPCHGTRRGVYDHVFQSVIVNSALLERKKLAANAMSEQRNRLLRVSG